MIRMNLLYIADSTSIHTRRWVEYFRDAGHQVSIITLGRKTESIRGVRHLANFNQFYYGSPAFLPVLLRTRKIIRQLNPQILHAHFVHQYGWLGALAGRRPFVLTAWGTDILQLPNASRSRIGKRLTTFTLKKADLLTATSGHLKSEMVQLGADGEKVEVIFWGVDPQRFHPDIPTEKLRAELDIGPAQPVILSNRNQILLYNNDVVVRAMRRILAEYPQAVLVLQNAGGDQEANLRELARSEGVENAVRFIGPLPHKDMPPLYAMADIFVSLPSWDAGPVSLKEAMSSGAVPIISDLPGPKEWVRDGVNGKVLPDRDPVQLAAAVCSYFGDKESCVAIRRRNRQAIVDRGNHTDIMRRVEQHYRNLIDGKRFSGS